MGVNMCLDVLDEGKSITNFRKDWLKNKEMVYDYIIVGKYQIITPGTLSDTKVLYVGYFYTARVYV